MTEIKMRICDECGKKENMIQDWKTPYNWLRLEKIKLIFRTSKTTRLINNKNLIEIDESTDPDFCCEDCFYKWMIRETQKIMDA